MKCSIVKAKLQVANKVDVTGLIGQYAHGNEPSHHMAYLYNYVGKPEKTTEKVHYILENFYKNAPDGLIGNEDCGQMSAWYVLSSMGIYAVTPGNPEWTVIKPYFKNIKTNFEDSTSITITSENCLLEREYFGIDFLDEENTNNYKFDKKLFIPVPVFEAESKTFKDKMTVEISYQNKDCIVYFVVDEKDSRDDLSFVPYLKPFIIEKTSSISAFCLCNNKQKSNTISATFFKKPNNYSIDIKSKYNPQYHAGGNDGLIDGIFGTTNWRKGDWQGYQNQDFEATVDLQEQKEINTLSSNCLQDQRSWILMPTKVEYYVSNDNVNFILAGTVQNTLDPKEPESTIRDFTLKLNKPVKTKYVKVKAYNFGKLPEWHQGFPFDGDAFIFIDEITIK